jgi:two-component system, NarL family, nitrate/nitrite response regulator NarL
MIDETVGAALPSVITPEFPWAARLSPRQGQILNLVADGLSDKKIARQLGLSSHTVRTYLDQLFLIYRVHSRAALVGVWLRGNRLPHFT